MGMCDNTDTNTLMTFREEHWDLWIKFVKDDTNYCDETSEHKEYCNCENCKKIRGY